MLLKILNRNSIISLALLPLLLIGFWANSLISEQSPGFPYDLTPMPLWQLVVNTLKGSYLLSAFISMIIVLIQIFSINRITNRYTLFNGQTNLPGIVYLLFVSGYLIAQKLHPVWFFTPLLMLSMERLFTAYGERKPMTWCFEASFWLSVGTLFYAKGIFFILFLWMVMFILRQFTLRSLLASLIGLVLPYLFAFGYFFWIDSGQQFFELSIENLLSPVAFFEHSLYSQVYNGFIIFLVFMSILAVVRIIPAVKIITRKHFRIFIWLIVLSTVASLTPYYSLEVIPIWAIGASIVVSRFLTVIQKPFLQELLLLLIMVSTIAAQFLI